MAIERYKLNNIFKYLDNFTEIKNWFDENMPDFFTSIIVEQSDTADETTGDGYKLIFKQDETEICVISTETFGGTDTLNKYVKLEVKNYCKNGYTITSNTYSDATSYPERNEYLGCSRYTNTVYEIIKINDYSVAFSLTNRVTNDAASCSAGTLIFTKTQKGNIATIRPSKGFINKSSYKIQDTSYTNYLSIVTKESMGSTYFSNILYQSSPNYITTLSHCPVVGDNDYCPYAFFAPTIQQVTNINQDGILRLSSGDYYFNGFIAVKI